MNKPTDCSDEKAMVNGLRNGDSKAYELLYRCCYKGISHFIRTNNGTEEDAKDIFHDSILVLIKNIRKPDFTLTAKCCVYLYSICRFQWLNKLKKKGRVTFDIDETNENYILIDEHNTILQKEYEDRHHTICKLLENWDHEICRELIVSFYFKKLNLKEIAQKLNYTYEFVRIKKHRCMNSFEKMIKEHQIFKDY